MAVPHDINQQAPKSGRMIREDNSLLNEADYWASFRESSVVQASRDGTLYRAFWSGSIPISTTYYFALSIPSGCLLYGEDRTVVVEAGSVRAAFLSGGTFTTIEEPMVGPFNFDNVDGAAAQVTPLRVSGLSGQEQQSPSILVTAAGQGANLRPSIQTSAGAQVVQDSDNLPFFMIQNPSTTVVAEVTLSLIWQELPK